ncbi:MAG: hypothetical protein K6A69_04550 [Lachnospiraceae bacterium]|nr:hypothetical protein [Lachnospiraceae bacterium]
MYKNYVIDVDNLDMYEGIIPDCFMERLLDKELFAIETCDDAWDDNPPIGIVVMGTRYNWAQIMWFGLSDGYDSADYASDLLREREFAVRRSGRANGIFAEMPATEDPDELIYIFKNAGFETELIESKVMEFTLSSVDPSKLIKVKDSSKYLPLREMNERDLRDLGQTMATDKRAVPIEMPVKWDTYHKHLSLVHMGDEGPDGTILVTEHESFYEVSLAYAKNSQVFIMMLFVLLERATQALPEDARIVVAPLDVDIKKTVEQITGKVERAKLVSAKKDYRTL